MKGRNKVTNKKSKIRQEEEIKKKIEGLRNENE